MSVQSMSRTAILAGLTIGCLSLPLAAQDDATSEDATSEPAVGQTYVAETHGDWELRCIRPEEGQPEPCQLYQLLVDENGGPVAEVNVFDIPDDGDVLAGATVVTPLETLLPPGLRIRVDDSSWAEFPFAFCQEIGCFARLGLTAENLDAFRAGGDAYVALVPLAAPDRVVELQASLSGFTAGFAALEERNTATVALFQQLRAAEGAAS